jgi:hypothetical protein
MPSTCRSPSTPAPRSSSAIHAALGSVAPKNTDGAAMERNTPCLPRDGRTTPSSARRWVRWAPPHLQGLGDALEFDHPDRLQTSWLGDAVGGGLADQHLPGARPGRTAGRRCSPLIRRCRRPGRPPGRSGSRCGSGQALDERLGHHLGSRLHCGVGLAEHEHSAVAQPAYRSAGIAAGDALDQCRGAPGELGGDGIALLLGQPGVAGEVDKAYAWWGVQALVQALGFEDPFEVADGVVEPDVLAVAPVERQKGLLEQASTRPGAAGSVTARITASARLMRSSGKAARCTCTWAPAETTRPKARRRELAGADAGPRACGGDGVSGRRLARPGESCPWTRSRRARRRRSGTRPVDSLWAAG